MYVHTTGEGVPADPKESLKYAQQCLQCGPSKVSQILLGGKDLAIARAHEVLGSAYRHGVGVGKDEAKAEEYLLQGAEGGYPLAQNNYATLLAQLPGRREEAMKWYIIN
jgi:TPR repeat protein